MKSMFGGSAIVAGALLASSLLLSAKPSIAETVLSVAQQQSQAQQPVATPAQPAQAAQLEEVASQPAQPPQPPLPPSSATEPVEPSHAAPPSESPPQPEAPSGPEAGAGICLAGRGVLANVSGSPQATVSNTGDGPKFTSQPATHYIATAYSLRGRTASGRLTARGLIAADPSVLPLGSRVRLEVAGYTGEYLVADTGGAVRGRRIDIWTPSSREALRFGRRTVRLTVLCYGPRRSSQKKRIRP